MFIMDSYHNNLPDLKDMINIIKTIKKYSSKIYSGNIDETKGLINYTLDELKEIIHEYNLRVNDTTKITFDETIFTDFTKHTTKDYQSAVKTIIISCEFEISTFIAEIYTQINNTAENFTEELMDNLNYKRFYFGS